MNSEDIIFIPGQGLDSNSYLIGEVLIDTGTGSSVDYLYTQISNMGIDLTSIKTIVNTHCHYDHFGGNYLFPNAEVAIHKLDAAPLLEMDYVKTCADFDKLNIHNCRVDKRLSDGDRINGLEIIHTPGHTSGGICIWNGETLISGDTVFANGGVGRTDLGGNWDELKQSVKRLTELDVVNLYPGHGPIVEGNGAEHIKLSYSLF